MLKRQDIIGVLELPGDAGSVYFVEVPETASLEYVTASGPDVRRQPQYQRSEVSAQHDILQGLDHDSASGISFPPPSQLGKTIGFDKAVPFDIVRDGGPRRIKRRGAARRRHPLKAQLEIEEVFVATRETTLAADGLLHDLDGIVDRQPPILLFIDAAIDEGTGLRNCRDELVKSAPAKQVLGQIEVHRRCRRYRIVRSDYLEQRLGRIVRQGNGFDRVHDFRYVSTGTFDSYLYSIVERKQRFISQVFTNKSPVRTMDDLDETVLSLAQMKQIAEGDPTVAERMDVENKIGQLKLMRESHLEGLADVQHKIETQYRPLVDALAAERDMLADDQIPFSEADLVRQQTLGSKDSFLTVGGTHIADREEAIRALRRAAYDVRPGCQETIGTYRGLSVVCRRQHVLDDDWLPYIGLAVDPGKTVHMSERVFPSGEKGAFTVLTQMDRIIAKDAKGPAEIELKLGTAHRALADAQKAAKEPFPKQAELDELEQRLAVLEQERIEAELQCQREQAQRDEAEAAAIEVGVEEERETEREHERAAAADDEAREAARMAELRRQGLICEDSAAHNAATAVPNGVALGVPGDIAEAARCSAAASARDGRAEGEKRKAGM